MTQEIKLPATLSRSLSLDQAEHHPLLAQKSPLKKIDSLPTHQLKSASFSGFFSGMRKVRDTPFHYGNIADAGLSRLVSRLPSRRDTSNALTLSKPKDIALAELSAALSHIDHCQKIGFADSTTGAHCVMDENYDALFMVKSNDECFFEFLGNCVAEKLELNIPGFALVDHATEQYASLKEKLSSDNAYPCMLSEYREAVNLKEVDRGSPLDPIESFKALGKAFVLDLVIGNWDRFPVFPGDNQGNYGNLMYEASTQQLLFIDIVAMKHTELGGYQSKDYFDFSPEKIKNTLSQITQWLKPKFPQLQLSEETTRAFCQGMEEATHHLLKQQSSLIEMFHHLKTHLQHQIQIYEQEVVPALLANLKEQLLNTETSTANPQTPSEEALLAILQTRIPQVITDEKAAQRMSDRIKSGGLPQIGPLRAHADTLKKDSIFQDTWHQYSEVKVQRQTQQKIQKILTQLENPTEIIGQLDVFLENIKGTDLEKTEAGQQLSVLCEETEKLIESIKKLDMMTESFCSIELKLKPIINK